jgi:glycerol uptake facilitator-like aquaporin
MPADLLRRAASEGVGTAVLLAAVVGSGIMAERLCGGNVGLALLANAIATGGALVALILAFGPVSGAHFNPAVSLADAWLGGLNWRELLAYVGAQVAGALAGVALAHGMFAERVFSLSHHARSGPAQVLSEAVATFGLLTTIWGCVRRRPEAVPYAVAAYITGAYWFTASTSFANPAVTLARSFTDSFSGIQLADVPGFVGAQFVGAMAATALFRWLDPALRRSAPDVAVPHQARSRAQPEVSK